MLVLSENVKVYISLEPIDMRKAIDGLSVLVVEVIKESPQSGHVFLFHNKQRNKVKALYWDRNGFIMHYKRLERGRFKFHRDKSSDCIEISKAQLEWLFAGLDFMTMAQFPELNFKDYF